MYPAVASKEISPTRPESRKVRESIAAAVRTVSTEIYSRGLHHCGVAEKYNVSVRAITWLMKKQEVGFASRNMGEPPEHVRDAIWSLC